MPGDSEGRDSIAGVVARFLSERGVERIFGLCGGHIMPIWMAVDALGIPIVDVRDERAAVHMAHAHAEITGKLGVALVTAGPGVTNAITGIANAHVARAPVLVISGVPPRPQEFRGALQGLDHVAMLGGITRYARTVREQGLVLPQLDEAVACALGEGGEPGPAYVDFPTDLLSETLPPNMALKEFFEPRTPPSLQPDPQAAKNAMEAVWTAVRPLVIGGRGARGAKTELAQLLDRSGAIYLDTTEARGVVADDHPSLVNAMRGAAMGQADLVVTVGRKLDFQLAYGSPAVFKDAQFVRIADNAAELRDNRRGVAEVLATPSAAIAAILEAAGNAKSKADREWAKGMRAQHVKRANKMQETSIKTPPGSDGRMHPMAMLGTLGQALDEDAILIADGGDILSFARVALSTSTYLDPGALGCLGVGVPFGIAAALAAPDRQVAVVTGDGSFGFNAIEIDTAARHKAPVVFIIANNGAWNIEVYDQQTRFDRLVGTELEFSDYAAMGRAFGLHTERVEDQGELAGAIDRAFDNAPALLDVVVTRDAVSFDSKSGLAWVPDLQPLAAWDEAEHAWRAGEPVA